MLSWAGKISALSMSSSCPLLSFTSLCDRDCSCSNSLTYLPPPKNILVKPFEVAICLKHKNLLALLNLMIRNWENLLTRKCQCTIEFMDFLDVNYFFSWCSRLGWGTIMCNLAQHFRIDDEVSLVFENSCCF